jgi:DNA repair exonuclease SbcCD ATPase subunit
VLLGLAAILNREGNVTDVKHEIPEYLQSIYERCGKGYQLPARQSAELIENLVQLRKQVREWQNKAQAAQRQAIEFATAPQDERIAQLTADLAAKDSDLIAFIDDRDAALREVERLREEIDITKQLDKAKLPCGHNSRYGHTENGGRTGDCYVCEVERLKGAIEDIDATLCECRHTVVPEFCNCDIHASHAIARAALKAASEVLA